MCFPILRYIHRFILCGLICPIESKHTQTYTAWKNGSFTKTLFLRDTYLGFNDNPCQKITRRDAYIKILESKGIFCSGDWCDSQGGYSCMKNPCYNMEHIIDSGNSKVEFGSEYDKNILGNYVMAYSTWNRQVGQLSWEDIKIEKKEIYTDVFDRAYQVVKTCHEYPDMEEQDDNIENDFSLIFFNIFVVCFVSCWNIAWSISE